MYFMTLQTPPHPAYTFLFLLAAFPRRLHRKRPKFPCFGCAWCSWYRYRRGIRQSGCSRGLRRILFKLCCWTGWAYRSPRWRRNGSRGCYSCRKQAWISPGRRAQTTQWLSLAAPSSACRGRPCAELDLWSFRISRFFSFPLVLW